MCQFCRVERYNYFVTSDDIHHAKGGDVTTSVWSFSLFPSAKHVQMRERVVDGAGVKPLYGSGAVH